MDTRAGGATEADEAGVTEEAIQGALTHTNKATRHRYIHRRAKLAEARKQSHLADNDGGMT